MCGEPAADHRDNSSWIQVELSASSNCFARRFDRSTQVMSNPQAGGLLGRHQDPVAGTIQEVRTVPQIIDNSTK